MFVHDWFDWTNAGVGAAGLVLTVGALWQATGAKKAAQLAGKNVRQHVAEVDFESLMRLAKELHASVEDGRLAEARLRTTDLRSDLAVAIRHHAGFLGASAERLKEKQFDLKLVTDGLNREGIVLSLTERNRLLGITGAILEVLAAQCGEFRSDMETEVSNG